MNRGHAIGVSLLLALAIAAGAFAATRGGDPATAQLRTTLATSAAQDAAAADAERLDRYERSLDRLIERARSATAGADGSPGPLLAAADRGGERIDDDDRRESEDHDLEDGDGEDEGRWEDDD